jgi:ribonuclease R
VREWIRGQRNDAWDPLVLAGLAAACSATEQNATEAEREAVRVKGLRYLEGRLGDRASGMIAGLVPRGFFVELDDVPIEGFVRLSNEFDEEFSLDGAGVRLTGRRTRRRFTLGDRVEVIIARIDVPARECDFSIITPRMRKGRGHGGRLG